MRAMAAAFSLGRRLRPARCRCRCGLDSTSASPGRAPPLVQTRSGCTRPCTASPKIGSSRADGVAAGHHAPGLGDHLGGGGEDGADGLDRQPLGEGGDVEGEHAPGRPWRTRRCRRWRRRWPRSRRGRRPAAGRSRWSTPGRGRRSGGRRRRRRTAPARRAASAAGGGAEVAPRAAAAAPRPTWPRTRRTTSTRSVDVVGNCHGREDSTAVVDVPRMRPGRASRCGRRSTGHGSRASRSSAPTTTAAVRIRRLSDGEVLPGSSRPATDMRRERRRQMWWVSCTLALGWSRAAMKASMSMARGSSS